MIETQYVYKNEVIGTVYERENLPTFLKIPPRRTLKDLLAIPLVPTNRPITCMNDPYQVPDVNANLDDMAKRAFLMYCLQANVASPRFDSRLDLVRYKVARLLRKVGVIL